jgi:hypothetical protein
MTDEGAPSVVYLLPLQRAATLPQWDYPQGDPPLSQQRAVTIAHSELQRRKVPIAQYRLQNVSLNRVLSGPYNHLWYYSVEFLPRSGPMPKPYWTSFVIVLMDGSVVDASPAQ